MRTADTAKLLLLNKAQNAQQDVRSYMDGWREICQLEHENKKLRWLIVNGERVFGSLWREASDEDIELVRRLPSECEHNYVYDGHGHNYSIWKCLNCGDEQER